MLRLTALVALLVSLTPALRAAAQEPAQEDPLPSDGGALLEPPPNAASEIGVAPPENALAAAAGCTPVASRLVPGGAWVACAGGVVVRLDARTDPPGYSLRSSYRVAGEVEGFFEHGGRVWAELVRREAVALVDPSASHGAAPRFGGEGPAAMPGGEPPPGVPAAATGTVQPLPVARRGRGSERRQRIAPERVSGFSAEARVHAFVGGSVGVLGQLGARYRFEAPVSFELRLPLLAYSEDLGMGYGTVLLGWDDRIFGLAVGYGTGTVREVDNAGVGQFDGFASLLTVSLRLGAMEGLMVRIDTTLYFIDRESFYAASEVLMQFPISDGNFVVLRGGGGGAIGHGYGYLGLRRRIHGDGGRGSIFLTPAIGGAGIFNNIEDFFGFGDLDGRPRGGFAFSFGVDALL